MKTLILTGYGINSDLELAECFRRAGSEVEIKHLNEVIAKPILFRFHVIAFPGGFSFGDHIASGKIFANKIQTSFFDKLREFISLGRLVLGICNGFQVLVKCGLLPHVNYPGMDPTSFTLQQATLTHNDHAKFEDRWVRLKANPNNQSPWLKNIDTIHLPVRHGEGKFYAEDVLMKHLKAKNQIALQYVDAKQKVTQQYPANPNGSLLGIAAITNLAGNVLGMMPHPEVYMDFYQGQNWTSHRTKQSNSTSKEGQGMIFFHNAVQYIQRHFEKT